LSCVTCLDNQESKIRQARQSPYRGNQKFQVPEYLRYSLTPDHFARTLYSNDQRGINGNFNYEYQTDNAISVKQESTGYGPNKVVRGYYSYLGPDGIQYTVNYVADRYGYRAYGNHLPTQPNEIYDLTQLPSQQSSSFSRPAPTQLQHHTQTAFIPPPRQQQQQLQSQNIFVTEQPPNNFISITPKPIASRHGNPSVNILPPLNYASVHSFNNQPIAWTTPRTIVI
jgi:Insect cuticle protein